MQYLVWGVGPYSTSRQLINLAWNSGISLLWGLRLSGDFYANIGAPTWGFERSE